MSKVTPERLERRSLRQLFNGNPERAEISARKLIAQAPECASGWAALKGALAAQGRPADAEALRGALAEPAPAAAGPIDRLATRKLSPRGLIFDPVERFRVRPMAEVLGEVKTAAALRSGADVVWFIDRGGQPVETWPVLGLDGAAGPEFPSRFPAGPKFVTSIANAAVVGEGMVLTRDAEFLQEIHPPCRPSKYAAQREGEELAFEPAAYAQGQRAVKVFDTPAFLMAGPTDTAFGDWMVNFIPRLALYEAAGLDCPILLRWKPPRQVFPILEALGVPAERLIFHTTHQISLFPKIFAPSWPSGDKIAPMDGVYDICRRASLPPNAERPLIYLDRRGLSYRPLANEQEVCDLFASRGFRMVSPGELSFDEVRRLFASPACVAGPFGSAYLNLSFAGNHPLCLALVPSHLPYHLEEMALWQGQWGNRFAYVLGEKPAGRRRSSTPWTVSLDKVERALDRMMELVSAAEPAEIG